MDNEFLYNSIEFEESEKIGMRWYKFFTYFWLPCQALFGCVCFVAFMPGVLGKTIDAFTIENVEIKLYLMNFLNIFENLTAANLIISLGCCALAVYRIYISISLIKFKKSAPKHVSILYILSGALGIIYFVISLIIMRESIEFDAEVVAVLMRNVVQTAGETVILVLIYNKYFNNRKHLFIN